jgi:hypothetical protein
MLAIWYSLCVKDVIGVRSGRRISCHVSVVSRDRGNASERSNSTTRGDRMPAFTFEKISPPVRSSPIAPIEKKQHSVIVQILDRFVEARVKRKLVKQEAVILRRNPKTK